MSNVGLRILVDFERPSQSMIESFRGLPVANIADTMNRMFCMHSRLRPINSTPLLGPAFTVKVRAGDNLLLHKAMELAQPGDVLVVDAQGDLSNAIIGELMVLWAKQRRLGGFIIDGAVRDLNTLKHIDLPIYAAGATPAGPYKDGPGEINLPVTCGGVVVNPGDIVVGDEDGVVVVSPADAESLLQRVREKNALEVKTKQEIARLAWDRSWVDKALQERGCEYITRK
ncbi:RraA family protein [Dickeya solani]|uniref:Putative 4-hydroxy-4-methyl-2-oxoglutarate aldolase n=2 Tax=Dickeya solani TaxID=1089444 RepID=A0ABU4EJ17_9GAMM|nr:RraA family protein [Dickeya solani]ANE75311.1 methyltransferase [Dickeya solani IPO 2222]AUC42709.1 Dimethylmenaquinone methyltransferase family protein [Dickeya solani RNS 08.23.3.1.A]AUH09275.1 methyltransferase [Dickeya solani D s0432-1]AUH13249.1 methyltransferase [Dickeya solani]AYQ49856.1 4-hydroxy-4-methyl-2-oxoglutarate aldolase [Dickeya solani]